MLWGIDPIYKGWPWANKRKSSSAPPGPVPTGLLSGTTYPSQPQAQPNNLVPQPAGEFNSATGWSTHTGLSIDTAAGLARWNGAQTTQQTMSIDLTSAAVAGREYGLLTSVPSRSAGQITVRLGTPGAVNFAGVLSTARSRSGRIAATAASLTAQMQVNAGSILTIDYIRIFDLTLMLLKKWRIFFVYSQSNWVGAEANDLDAVRYVPDARVLMVPGVASTAFGAVLDANGYGYPMPAVDPMQHQTSNAGGGPGGAFCKTIADGLRNDEIAIYVLTGYAGGGRLAANAVWNREDNGAAWAKMVATVNYLRSLAPSGSTVAGAVFCQGESDRGASAAPIHAAAIKADFEYLRNLWGNFPVAVMPIGGSDWNVANSNTQLMIQEHYKLDSNSGDALAMPRCKAVRRNPAWALRTDGTHYDQPSCELRGADAGTSILNIHYGIAA